MAQDAKAERGGRAKAAGVEVGVVAAAAAGLSLPHHPTPAASKRLPGKERTHRGEMESGSGYGASTDISTLRGPSQKPKLEGSSTSTPPFDMTGHLHSGLLRPLPGPLGGEGIQLHADRIHMHASPEVADQDRDPGYETQDKLSYPLLVVVPPP